ncbi:MAG: hypothetical protein APR54_09630 [Candidatus Cloacimonas sp. SDB]|nr:MAG: hypothetical protein APR54_09630 [Candidatus Cloacimonas sp. SDB]
MKKLLFIILGICLGLSLFADIDFYGQARTGLWYDMQDEDLTGTEARTEMSLLLYKNSRLGMNFSSENYKANAEIGFSESVVLRQLYGEYQFKKFSLLAGKTYTGFSEFASQVVSCLYSYDNMLIGYGQYYDGSQLQIRFTLNNGIYFSLQQPKKIDPAGFGADAVDALIPKISMGYKTNFDKIYFHTTFGLNITNYNKEMTDGIDESIMAYIGALTLKYVDGPYYLRAQVNFGQNSFDYGILGSTARFADWDYAKNEIINLSNFGGYAEFGYTINEKTAIKTGFGYSGSEMDTLDETDGASSLFFQSIHKLAKDIWLIPEVGMINDMEDGMGNKEGARTYFGAKLQMNFSHK